MWICHGKTRRLQQGKTFHLPAYSGHSVIFPLHVVTGVQLIKIHLFSRYNRHKVLIIQMKAIIGIRQPELCTAPFLILFSSFLAYLSPCSAAFLYQNSALVTLRATPIL